MADTLAINVRDIRYSNKVHVRIPVIGQTNPCFNYDATEDQIRQLMSIPNYEIRDAATGRVINGHNLQEYFPDGGGGGGGGDGDKSRYTVVKVTDNSTGEVTYKLQQRINTGSPTYVGDVIGIRGGQMLVQYGNQLTILNTALADIKTKVDANYNFTTFTALGINTNGKTLKEITDLLHAKNLPTNTIVTGQLYSSALPFTGNGEAEVMINSPAYWWKCTSLNVAPYSWNAIAGGGSWSGVIMDWTPTYGGGTAATVTYDNTTSGASATNVQGALDTLYSATGDKVDKVQGKGLSTNDFTDAYKEQIGANELDITLIKSELEKVGTTFRGVFNSQEALDASVANENDTAILQSTDSAGNTLYTVKSYVAVEPAAGLPSGYTQLLYIQSSGTQYVDTGIGGISSKHGIYMKFDPLEYIYAVGFFGIDDFSLRGYSDKYLLRTDADHGSFGINGTTVDIGLNFPGVNEFEYKYPSISVNGDVSTAPDTGSWSYSESINLFLFGIRSTSGNAYMMSSMRLYECKIYDEDGTTLLGNFIPVRNSSNVVGLYDLVTETFFANNGSGSFTAGPAADGYWVTDYTLANNVFSENQLAAISSGVTSSHVSQIGTNTSNISDLQTQVGYANTELEEVL